MSGCLTTHVLDTMHGRPAAGLRVDLHRIAGSLRTWITGGITNADGRLDEPLLAAEAMQAGVFELTFHVGAYFAQQPLAMPLPEPPFLNEVPIRFGIASPDDHYHVPLLVTPFGFSTYRGS